jgi:hypothetical protein
VVIHTNFVDRKTLLTDVTYLYVNCNGGSRICTVEWIRANMWCVNPYLTNKMLVSVNAKLGHFNDRVLLPKESLKPITYTDIWDIWIKFLRLTIVIIANLNTIIVTPRCYYSSYSTSIVASTIFIQWWLQYKPNSMKMVFLQMELDHFESIWKFEFLNSWEVWTIELSLQFFVI